MLYLSLSNLVAVSLNQVGDAGLPLGLISLGPEGPGLLLGVWPSKCRLKVSFDIPIDSVARYTNVPYHTILLAFSMASVVYFFFYLTIFIPEPNSLTGAMVAEW